MESDSGSQNHNSRDIVHHEDESRTEKAPGEDMDKEHKPLPWGVPTRDERELRAAEDIIKFAQTPRQDPTRSAQQFHVTPDSTIGTASQDVKETPTEVSTSARTKNIGFETTDSDVAALTSVGPLPVPIASEVGSSGSGPTESACFKEAGSCTSNYEDTNIPIEGAGVPISHQLNSRPVFKPNLIPVTNSILAAIAERNEMERSPSGSPLLLKPLSVAEMNEFYPKNLKEMHEFILEQKKLVQGSDISSSTVSTPESPAPESLGHGTPNGEERVQNEQDNSDIEKNNDYPQPNKPTDVDCEENNTVKKDVIPDHGRSQQNQIVTDVNTYDDACEADDDDDYDTLSASTESKGENENDNSSIVKNKTIEEGSHDVNEAGLAVIPEVDYASLRPEWSKQEKLRLCKVMKDMSREIKKKELRRKRSKLLKAAKDIDTSITRATENNMWKSETKTSAIKRQKTSKGIEKSFSVDELEDYDWNRIAREVNANRTPNECRELWRGFLHSSINKRE